MLGNFWELVNTLVIPGAALLAVLYSCTPLIITVREVQCSGSSGGEKRTRPRVRALHFIFTCMLSVARRTEGDGVFCTQHRALP